MQSSSDQVLLILDILIGTQQHVESAIFGPLNEFAVSQYMPAYSVSQT
jgi:hypothetical protein